MPLSMLGSFGTTQTLSPTDTAQVFTAAGYKSAYIVYTDRNIYLRILDAEDVANNVTVTDQDLLITSAEGYARVRLDAGAKLAYLLADNEVTGGTLKITRAGDDW